MKLYKKILIGVLIVFIAIQFIQPAHNKNTQLLVTDITKTYSLPDSVYTILRNKCYDCHSNTTNYPWYTNIQPMGWFMAKHIRDGKKDLNFSEFGSYSLRRQINKLRGIESSIKEGTMPISSYTIMHADVKLTSNDTATINYWVRKTKDSLTIKN
jgi:hypothetical protein